MRSLGLDIGEKKIGVALSDPGGILASPLTIIVYRDEIAAIAVILDLIAQHHPGEIVAGLPRSMDGREGQQSRKVRAFVAELQKETEVPVIFRDERLSTVTARRRLREAGRSSKTGDDAVAAAIVLQGYLDESF